MTTAISTPDRGVGFVGRQAELERFGETLNALSLGRVSSKRFLHLYGPAGIGKTTLLREFIRLCRLRDVVFANVSFEEERMRECENPYAEAVFIIATQLARQDIVEMSDLLNVRRDLQSQMLDSDSEQQDIASQYLDKFPEQVLEELVTLAHKRPVVLFIDGLEDPAESVRANLESPLLIRFAEAPQSMVVSASRATLPTTWSKALRDRFNMIQVPPLSSQEITRLFEEHTRSASSYARVVRNGPLMEVVREIGQGHVPVSDLVFGFLVNLLAEIDKQSGDSRIEPQSVDRLNEQQMGDLLALIHAEYLEPYALRDLHKDPWGDRVYRATFPARYLDVASLEVLISAIKIPRSSSTVETGPRALAWLAERGLIHHNIAAGVYRLDALPRDLMLRRMKHSSPEQLQSTTKDLRALYRSRIESQTKIRDNALDISPAIIEYLYHSYVYKQLQGMSPTAIENEIVGELELCLKGSSSLRTVDTLYHRLENDSELAKVFGQRLTSKVIETVRGYFPTEPGDNSTSRLIAEREALISDVLAGNCVLFLGPGLTLGSDYLAMFETFAQRLNEENGYKETVTRFEDVAQYYAGLPDKGRDKLIAEYSDYVEQHLNPDQSSLDVIVSLPFHNIITTTTDASLEIAYHRARWPVEVVTSPLASPRIERGEDLLVKLFGSLEKIDKLGARLDTRDTLILTRREQLQLQAHLAGADNLLESHLRAGVPLFIGFDHRDPNLYFLHTLVHRSSHLSGRRSYVALEEPNQFLGQAWQTEMVILDQCGRDLLQELQERWLDWQSNQMHLWDEAEVLEAIQAGRSVAGKLMSRIVFEERTNLIGQDMNSCVLTAGVLNGVLLNEALLERADLSNATLQDAQLKNCKARGANLTYANANRAQLGGAQFAKAVLTGVSMHDVEITGAVFDETDLIFAELEGARGEKPSFLNANLVGIDFSGAQLPGAAFRDSLIWDGNFRRAKLANVDFSMANLAEAGFEKSDLRGANFYFANLTGADFSGADVRGANFSQALLAGADLRDAVNVSEAKFTNATWQEAKLTPELRQQLEQAETDALQAGLPPGRLFELAHEALSGRCILFVGPGLTLGPQYLDTYDRIKTALAKECGLSESGLGFQDVAQYFAATKSRDSLIQKVTQELRSSFQVDNAGLDLVVSLPFDVILTTALDTELESAYGRAGRPFERIVSLDKSAVLEKGEDLIIRLYGGIDVMDAPLVLTRRDRYQMQDSLAHNDSALSKYIGSRVPLFVGFSLRDPALYMLHTLISKPDAPLAGKSFVALDEPCSFFGEAWKSESLVILDRPSHNLLEDLHHQWVEQKSAERRIWNTAEVLEAIHAGRSVAGKRISRIALEEGSDLQKQDLSYCMLTSGTLNGVLLNGALLPGADLSNSEMEDAELSNCNLLGANMFRVKLNRAKLNGADLGKAVLVQAALRDVDLTGARLAEADLIFADLQGASGKGVDFTRANFSSALLSGSILPEAGFRSSFGERAEFRHAELSGADFQMSNLAETKFESANLTGASFHASNLTGADFSNADLRGVNFSQARLDGVDFNDANNVLEADFTDSAWQKALLPEELRQKLEQGEVEARSEV